jgi:phosphatidylglycerophosphatase C
VKRRIAFFDFDGTLTTKDTLLEMIKFHKGAFWFYLGFLINSPFLVAYKLKIISNQLAKEMVLRYFFRKETIESFQQKCDLFVASELPALMRQKGVQEIQKLVELGAEVVIVTASASNWVKPPVHPENIRLLSTELEVINGKLTGRLIGKNCHGHEKVSRIKAAYDLSAYDEIFCYGDTNGDKPMLELATVAFYKPFR